MFQAKREWHPFLVRTFTNRTHTTLTLANLTLRHEQTDLLTFWGPKCWRSFLRQRRVFLHLGRPTGLAPLCLNWRSRYQRGGCRGGATVMDIPPTKFSSATRGETAGGGATVIDIPPTKFSSAIVRADKGPRTRQSQSPGQDTHPNVLMHRALWFLISHICERERGN